MADTTSATRAELAAYARRHYEGVSGVAQSWYSLIPEAIDAWEREPQLEAQILRLQAELHQAREAGGPYSQERDAMNTLILENIDLQEKLRAKRAPLRDRMRRAEMERLCGVSSA